MAFKSEGVLEQEYPVSIRVKVRSQVKGAKTVEGKPPNQRTQKDHTNLITPWVQARERIEIRYEKENTKPRL